MLVTPPPAPLPPPPGRLTLPPPDKPLELFDEEEEPPLLYYEDPDGEPVTLGDVDSVVDIADGLEVPLSAVAEEIAHSINDTNMTFYTKDGYFAVSGEAPHISNQNLTDGTPIIINSTFVPYVEGVTVVIQNAAYQLSSNETALYATYDAYVNENLAGSMNITTQYFLESPPKATAVFAPVQGGPLANSHIVWKIIPAFPYLRSSNDPDDYATTDLSEIGTLYQLEWADDYLSIVDAEGPRNWTANVSVSWLGESGATVWAGPVIIDAQRSGSGIEIRFPAGDFFIDPVALGYSQTIGLGVETQRRSFTFEGKYWQWWINENTIHYATSADGRAWRAGANSVSSGLGNNQFFDVTNRGGLVLLAFKDNRWGMVTAMLGNISGEDVIWSATVLFPTLYSGITGPVSVAITTDGFLWVSYVDSTDTSGTRAAFTWRSDYPGDLYFLWNYLLPYDLEALSSCKTNFDVSCTVGIDTAVQLLPRENGNLTLFMVPDNSGTFAWKHYNAYWPTSPGWSGPYWVGNKMSFTATSCGAVTRFPANNFTAVALPGDIVGIGHVNNNRRAAYFEIVGTSSVQASATIPLSNAPGDVIEASIGADLTGTPIVIWIKRECNASSQRNDTLEYSRRSPTGTWGSPATITNTGWTATGTTAIHVPEMIFPSMLVSWRAPTASASRYSVSVKTVQLPVSSPSMMASGYGSAPSSGLVGEKGFWVSSTSGQLFYTATDASIGARGLSLVVPRIYESVRLADLNGTALLHEDSPYAPLGPGWGLDYPWISANFVHLPGGARFPFTYGASNAYNVSGIPFNFTVTSGNPTFINMHFTNGMLIQFKKVNQSSPNFLVSKMWDSGASTVNGLEFSYNLSGPDAYRLYQILDPAGRYLQFNYTATRLVDVAYVGDVNGIHGVANYSYWPSGLLRTVRDADGNRENYTYDTTGKPWGFLNNITFREGGRAMFNYSVGASVGTDSQTWVVNGATLFAVNETTNNATRVARSYAIGYHLVNGVVMRANITLADGFRNISARDILRSPSRGYTSETLRDVDGLLLSKQLVWYSGNGAPYRIEKFVGQNTTAVSSEFVRFDNWGNPIYARDANGYEAFSSYYHTDTEGGFRSAARLDIQQRGTRISERFDAWEAVGWTTTASCGGTRCMLSSPAHTDAPVFSLQRGGGQGSASLYRTISPALARAWALFVVAVNSTQAADYEFMLKDANNFRAYLKLANLDGGSSYAIQYGTSSNWIALPGSYFVGTWYRIAVETFSNYTYLVYVNGTPLGWAPMYLQTGSIAMNEVQIRTINAAGNTAQLLVNEVGVSLIESSGAPSVTITNLPSKSVVELFDVKGRRIAGDREMAQGNNQPGVLTLSLTQQNSTALRVRIRSAEGEVLYDAATPLGSGDVFLFVPPALLGGLTSVESGYTRATKILVDNSPCKPDDLSGAACVWELGVQCSWKLGQQHPYPWCGTGGDTIGDPTIAVSGWHSHGSPPRVGIHQHYFQDHTQPMLLNWSDYIIQYVYIPTGVRPSEIMLQFRANYTVNRDWNRVFWGENAINWGLLGTDSRRYMGPLNASSGRWSQLIVRASDFGVWGNGIITLDGMAWTLYGGAAVWDFTSKGDPYTGSIRVEDVASGQWVELINATGARIASTLGDANGVANISFYEQARISVLPFTARIRVRTGNSTSPIEYVSPQMQFWGGDTYAYKKPDSFANTTVPTFMHSNPAGTLSWDLGREIVNLDMQTRTLTGSTRMIDFSGYGQHGALTGALALSSGVDGKALNLSGSNNYVTVPATTFDTPTKSMSVSMWIYPEWSGETNLVSVVSWGNTYSTMGFYFSLLPASPSTDQYVGASFTIFFTAGNPVSFQADDSVWKHHWNLLVATYDGHEVRFYVNGVLKGSGAAENKTIRGGSALPYYVGKAWSDPYGGQWINFKGRVDEFRLYSRGITEEQVAQLNIKERTLARKTYYNYTWTGQLSQTKTEVLYAQVGQGSYSYPWILMGYAYDSNLNLVRTTSQSGQRVNYTYASSPSGAYLASIEMAVAGGAKRWDDYTFDIWGRVTSHTSPMGYITNYSYDAIGRLLLIQHPAYNGNNPSYFGTFPNETWTYSDIQRNVTYTAPSGWQFVKHYDGLGRVVAEWRLKSSGFRDQTFQYTYNAFDAVVNVTGPDSSAASYRTTFDALGRPLTIQGSNLGSASVITRYVYDDLNMTVTMKDPNDHWTMWKSDLYGRVLSVCQWPQRGPDTNCFTSANAAISRYEYDLAGQVIRFTDPSGGVRRWSYNQVGEAVRAFYADGTYRIQSTVIDLTNNKVDRTTLDPSGLPWTVRINGAGELDKISYFDGANVNYYYDLEGRLINATNPEAQYSFAYNSWSQVTYKNIGYARLSWANKSVEIQYDRYMRLEGITYPNQKTVQYGYTVGGPGDHFDRVRFVTGSWGGIIDQISYNRADQPTSRRINGATGGWTETFTYDNYWRVTSISTPQRNWGYGYFENGNAKNLTYQGAGQTYTYDNMSRLLTVTGTDPVTFTYDLAGNRRTSYETTPVNYSYGAGNLLTNVSLWGVYNSTWSYNSVGAQVRIEENGNKSFWNYTYYSDGRLKQVYFDPPGASPAALRGEYGYGPDGEILYSSEQGTERYIFPWAGGAFFEFNNTSMAKNYVRIGQEIVGLRIEPQNSVYYAYTDGFGNVAVLVSPGQAIVWENKYKPFGESTTVGTPSVDNPYGFVGNSNQSAVNLMFFHGRWYNPNVGRFISRDPLDGQHVNTQTPNLYTYGVNNPRTFSDKWGLCPICALPVLFILGVIFATGAVFIYMALDPLWFTQEGAARLAGVYFGTIAATLTFAVLPGVASIAQITAVGALSGAVYYASAQATEWGLSGSLEWDWGDFAVSIIAGAAIAAVAAAVAAPLKALAGKVTAAWSRAAASLRGAGAQWLDDFGPGRTIPLSNTLRGVPTKDLAGVPTKGTAARLSSVEDVMASRGTILAGKTPAEVEAAIGRTPGWRIETLGKGDHAGQGWMMREYLPNSEPSGRMIRWHPGGGHHGPEPYWRVNGYDWKSEVIR